MLEAVQNHFWSQHVDFMTRRDPSSGNENLLDPCLCSHPDLVLGVESQGWFSDHAIYSVDLVMPCIKDSSVELVPNWKAADLNKLAANLAEVDWASELGQMTGLSGWEVLKERINAETDRCVPRKKRRTSNKPLWMNKNVMRLIRKKRRAWRWYTSSNTCREDY